MLYEECVMFIEVKTFYIKFFMFIRLPLMIFLKVLKFLFGYLLTLERFLTIIHTLNLPKLF